MRYIKYIGICLLDLILYILAILIFPIAYILRPEKGFLWWFLNDGNMYGANHEKYWKHYGKEKWWVAYVWNVIRNSHWNFRMSVLKPKLGEHEDVRIIKNYPDALSELQLRSFEHYDKYGDTAQYSEYSKGGSDYFRWSEVKEVSYFGIKRIRQMMFGWNNKRPLFKIRHRKT